MTDSGNVWNVDWLAASGLLAALKVEPSAEALEAAARHLAKHRQYANEWGAQRVLSAMAKRLEAVSGQYFGRKSAEWTNGFRAAEEKVITATVAELLGRDVPRPKTTGQILRGMISRSRRLDNLTT